MQSSGGMRQVFAVEGGRGCRVECKQEARSRKRGRNGKDVPPMRNGGAYPPWEHENDEDWEEEDVQFVSDANRSVSWSASGGGLTIRARNSFPESNKKRDCDGISGRRGIAQPRRQDPYDLWGMDEEIDEFEEDFPARNRGRRNDCLAAPPSRSRYQRQEEFRYMEDSPPSPRSLGPIPPSYRRNYPDERVHERGYPARDLGLKDGLRPLNLRERSSSRRLSPPPSRFDTFERERRRERDCSRRLPAHSSRIDPFERERSRRFSPPSRLDSFEREHLLERNCSRRLSPPQDRFDYFESEPPRERNCSRRLTPPPPSRIRSRDRCDSLDPNGHWEDERRKDRGDDYFRRDASRADVREEDDLPPGFGSHTDRKPEGTPRQPKNDCEERLDPRSCYFCGKVGHLSLNCPTKPDRSERSPKRSKLIEDADATGKTCFTCGQIGHFSFQCPTRASDKAKPGDSLARRGKQCYSCGDYGHVSIACPTNKSGGGKDQASGPRTLRRCYNCYEIGHLVHECPMFSDGDALRNEPAQEDSDAVMYKTKLTDAEKHQYLKENRCFTCGKSGHPYYSCPQSEKRLEYVFFDREYKSSWKMLRNPCWKYKDEQGDVHGPVSLSSLSTRLEEGVVPRDTQVHHMYNGNLQPIALGNLVRISKSSSLVAILGCMPEAASFLGEDMDAESCKTNALAALQTKMHYDIFETTVRWLVISSMNEALQHYKTARKSWGKHRPPPAAEDYLEPDRSGPPHSSDCELSSPDGIRDAPGQFTSFHAKMLIECEKHASDTTSEDPLSNVLGAIRACIHSGAVGAARTSILDAFTAAYLDSWIKPDKELLQLTLVPEVISEEHSEDSKGTYESSPSPVETNVELDEKRSRKQKQPLSLRKLKKQTLDSKQEKTSSPKKQRPTFSKPLEEVSETMKQIFSKPLEEVSETVKQKLAPKKQRPTFSRPLEEVSETTKQNLSPKKQRPTFSKPLEEVSETMKQIFSKPLEVKQKLAPKKQKPIFSKPVEEVPEIVKQKQALSKPAEEASGPVVEEEVVPVDLDSFMRYSKKRKPESPKNTESAPELVLHIFRKAKKNSSTNKTPLVPSTCTDSKKPAKKRVLKLCDLVDADAKATEVEEPSPQNAISSFIKLEAKDDGGGEARNDPAPVGKVAIKVEIPEDHQVIEAEATLYSSRCPRSAGCARSSIDGWEWRDWSRKSKMLEADTEAVEEFENLTQPPKARSTRSTRAQTRKLASADGMSLRKKQLKFQRSKIHSWGVIAMESIEAEDLVIEYVGELLRPKVADIRESRYEKQGVGSSYLFRVGDGCVIDATVRGGLARFINHSCEPNCYTKIISIEGRKRVFIYARKFIAPGTELTYDYKFPIEANINKIPCLCRSAKCRLFLN